MGVFPDSGDEAGRPHLWVGMYFLVVQPFIFSPPNDTYTVLEELIPANSVLRGYDGRQGIHFVILLARKGW